MPNSHLINHKFIIPDFLLPKIYYTAGGEHNISERMRNFIEKRNLSYYDMKNYLTDYQQYSDDEKNVNGGVDFYNWVIFKLNKERKRVERHKDNMDMANLPNSHIKPHEKDLGRPHSHKKLYEGKKTVVISEECYKKLYSTK